MQIKKFVPGRLTSDSIQRTINILVRFSGSEGGQMGWTFYQNRRIHIFLRKSEAEL
jgi:hypothetical protein